MAFEKTPVRFQPNDSHSARKLNALVDSTVRYKEGVEREHSAIGDHRGERFEHALVLAEKTGSGWVFYKSSEEIEATDATGTSYPVSIANISLFPPGSPWGLLGSDNNGRVVSWVRQGELARLRVAEDAERLCLVLMGPRDAP